MPSLGGETPVSKTTVWLTPPYLLRSLGEFDLDPCAATNRPWDTAKNHFTKEDDGLARDWFGRVWLNPPYGSEMEPWLRKMAAYERGGVALIFARTETRVFQDYVFPYAKALFFIRGRIRFHRPDGSEGSSAGAPSVLISYSDYDTKALMLSGLKGRLVFL